MSSLLSRLPFPKSSAPLSRRLRKETRTAHRLAEATRFAKAFFKGKLDVAAYAQGVARLYPVYVAMERAIANAPASSDLGRFHLPHVFRAPSMEKDLRHFGVAPAPDGHPAHASAAYLGRIEALAAGPDAQLLVAHAYVRYMGDVSGGILAGKVAQKVLGLPSREGLAFFDFPEIPDVQAFKRDFRARLDALEVDEAGALRLLDEANLAFDLNRMLADELFDEMLGAPSETGSSKAASSPTVSSPTAP